MPYSLEEVGPEILRSGDSERQRRRITNDTVVRGRKPRGLQTFDKAVRAFAIGAAKPQPQQCTSLGWARACTLGVTGRARLLNRPIY